MNRKRHLHLYALLYIYIYTIITDRFLVALTENHFAPNYFDDALIGAQADQEVLKEIADQKLPDLFAHFRTFDFDLASITLNWFLPLFFDSLPFEVKHVVCN